MRILLLSDKPPWPPDSGGAIAILEMLKDLACMKHNVTILCFETDKHNARNQELPGSLKDLCDIQMLQVDAKIRPLNLLWNLLFSRNPYNIFRYKFDPAAKRLIELLKKNDFDIIQFEGLTTSGLLPYIADHTKAATVYRAHNVEYLLWSGRASIHSNNTGNFYLNSLARRVRRYEMEFIARCDGIIPISEEDNSVFRAVKPGILSEIIYPVPPFSLINEPSFTDKQSDPASVRFIGSLDWEPNLHGLEWFVKNVWPQVTPADKNAELVIAGRGKITRRVKKLISRQVRLEGPVTDSQDFMAAAAVFVAPLFASSGVRIKILEAISLGIPVVTTSAGAYGLPPLIRQYAVVTDSENVMAESIIDIIRRKPDPQVRLRQIREVKEICSHSANSDRLNAFYNRVVNAN